MHGKWQAPKAFPLKPNYFFFPPCPSPAPNPATMEYQRFMTFQKNLFDIYIQRSACAPMPAPAPAPSRRLSIRCGSWLRSVPGSRYPVPGSRFPPGLGLGFYFPSCSLGQWGIKLPGLAFGRSRSAANWQGNGGWSRGFAIVVFIRFQNSTDIWSGTIGNAWFILRMIQQLKPESD